ncbi:MAG TPA: DUF4412 domain-containing protein [Steroidobacteraceae bacterium]|nr:DUF4412 domain-containing protein [Steroidobacteraceae bacterium]
MRLQLAGLALGLAAATTAGAGVVIQMADRDVKSGQQSDRDVWYAQGALLRVDRLDDAGHVQRMSILRDGAIWEVDVERRTYTRIDKAAMQGQMGVMDERMKAALASMPPERRAKMEQMMQNMQQAHHDYAWSDTGKSDRVGQYGCRTWEGRRDNKPSEEVCVAPTSSLPGGDELLATMRQASKVVQDVLSATPQGGRMFGEYIKRFEQMNGFPVRTRHLSGGQFSRESIVTKVERQSLPADKFEIPKGYAEKPLGKPGAGGDD